MPTPYSPPRPPAPAKVVRELHDQRIEVARVPVWVATVTAGQVAAHHADALVEMRAADLTNGWGLWAGRIVNWSGANVSYARNQVVETFLAHPAGEAEWLLWLDSDMVPPADIMFRLLAAATLTGGKVVGGLCVMDREEGPTPTIYHRAPPGADGITIVQFDYDEDTITKVDATGSACVMVHRSVFEAVAAALPGVRYPWYTEREVAGHWVSEDIHFCLKAGELGFGQYVDATTPVGHVKGRRVLWPSDIKAGIGVPPAKRVVVIPVKDRLDLTSGLVHQLREQGEATDIVICDNGSGTKARNWLATQGDLTVLDMPDAGVNEMWNAGALWAIDRHGPRAQVAILNNDLRIGPGFLGELSRALDSDRDLVAVSGNYDRRTGPGLIEETSDICAGRYDGTGGFAGFAFMVKGAFIGNGYRFPEQCRYWFGDSDLITAIAWTPEGKAGIALRAEVEHLDGGSLTAGDVGWSRYAEQTERDRAAFEARWEAFRAAQSPPETPEDHAATVAAFHEQLATTPSDINEHLPTLVELATGLDAQAVIELGVRQGVSTLSWLHAMDQTGGRLWSVDVDPAPPIGHPRWTFTQGDDLDPFVLAQLPAQADIVFIDTIHTYEHTAAELAAYRTRVRPGGCFVLHDVAVERFDHHEPGQPAFPVRRAVEEFAHDYGLRVDWHENNNGLAVVWLPDVDELTGRSEAAAAAELPELVPA